MLKIRNLKKHFWGVLAVDECSFEVKKGTITALIGPNGAGESTVFNLISGIICADKGSIKFQKNELIGMAPHNIANLGISRLFQQARLFDNLTVHDNLLLAMNTSDMKFWKNLVGNFANSANEARISNALHLINMEDFQNTSASEMSYGQKRLVELLRVMLKPHSLMMLDEPVAGVTPLLRSKIATILKKLRKTGETILLIEHDMDFTMSVADIVIVLDRGKVIAQGPPKKIQNDKKVLEAYLGN